MVGRLRVGEAQRRMAMRTLIVISMIGLGAACSIPAALVEGSFERTLSVSGLVDLEVKTGSGNISVRPGDSGSVRVIGRIRVNDRRIGQGEAEEKVRRL